MKLDRNINPDGRGKYALIKMRRVIELEVDAVGATFDSASMKQFEAGREVRDALETLRRHGALTYGDESPGDQFFVVKYKDVFAAPALGAYAVAAARAGFTEFADEIFAEEKKAALVGNRFPD